MLRPATPLSILLFIAFVLLLLSVISTPIVKGIPLATFDGIDFGVFGYCTGTQCHGPQIGYPTDSKTLFNTESENNDFTLPVGARSSLSSILIVHPIAALLTLVCFVLAASAHLHSPSHSPRYLLALLLLLIPTLLITLLAFLVDILLFVPHLQWGGWIVLASTILITTAGVVTCAMRRTLVSRKARKKRIAQNSEMNGENFYARQAATRAESPPPLGVNGTPMVNGTPGGDKLPTFATFETKEAQAADEDLVPLNTRTPSNRTAPDSTTRMGIDDGSERLDHSTRGGLGSMRGGRGGGYSGPRDEFGNPLRPSNDYDPGLAVGMRRDQSEPPMRRQYSNETMNSQGSRGRGRGGYPQRGYGRGGPYGPVRGGPGMNAYGRGMPMNGDGPPPGYGNGNAYPPMGRGPSDGYVREHSAPGYGRRPSPGPPSAPGGYGGQQFSGPSVRGGYARQPSPGPPSAPGGYGRQPSPGPVSAPGNFSRRGSPGPPSAPGGYAPYGSREPSPGPQGGRMRRAESPPPPLPIQHLSDPNTIGQAVEMDAYTGSPAMSPTFGRPMQLRDSDSDVQGLVGLQQQQVQQPRETSMSSVYSSQEPYVPPRAAWAGVSRNGTPPVSEEPIIGAVELPTPTEPRPQQHLPTHKRYDSGDNYYEDVDPRFADPAPAPQPHSPMPSSLMPGHYPSTSNIDSGNPHLEPSTSYESIQDGARSPAASDHSNYTSISQRGINPAWRPSPGPGQGMGMGGVPNRRPVPQQQDMLLTNPDFELPGAGRGGRGGHQGARGGRMPGPMPGAVPGGRYPGEI